MKPILYAAILVVLPLVGFSQQAGNSAPPALLKLRQDYINSLNLLREQYAGQSDAASAALVTKEIEKISSPEAVEAQKAKPIEAPVAVESASPVGVWAWHNNSMAVAINADGTIGRDRKEGVWHWIDVEDRKLQIDWSNGYVDKLAVATDGKTMRVVNNFGDEYTVRLIPKKNDYDAPERP